MNVNATRIAAPGVPRQVRGDTNVRRLGPWDSAAWVWRKDAPLPPGGEFVRFRCAFEAADAAPLRFHVSADERFVLLLDGKAIARGPDRGMPDMWFVQSHEARLSPGRHLVEAVCWRLNPGQAPNAQLSVRGGFLFKADGVFDAALTTGVAPWEAALLRGTRMTRGAYPMGPVGAQCECVGTGILDERPPDADYEAAVVVREAVPPDDALGSGSRRLPGWMLYPTELPEQLEREAKPGRFVAADAQAFPTDGVWSEAAHARGRAGWYRADAAEHPAVALANAMLAGSGPLVVAPRSKLRLLWDLGDYWCAYPVLALRGGAGATVAWAWAEALFSGDCFDWHTLAAEERKGPTSRAEWRDKYFYGIEDVFRPDGRDGAVFTTPWWRAGRWCQLQFETADEPLVLEGARLVETRYPFEPEGRFDCDDPTVSDVWRICLRGLEMCMHETFFDCPYYEQQMYGGDTRLQMLAALSLSGDGRLARQAFRLFEASQRDDGRVSMNYPTTWLQESTTYTLLWTIMLGDYALWRGDAAWVRARMPAVRKALFGMEAFVGADGLARGLPGWSFIDWVPEWTLGVAPGGGARGEGSAVENLLYLMALRSAASVEDFLGETELAARWRRLAKSLADGISNLFWCEERGMVADTAAKDRFSEHAQCLAVLANALAPEKAERAFEELVSSPDLARCTVSFSHYLFETFFRFGRADLFLKRLDTWRDFVRQDLKTPLEAPGDARSDCHAWGSHPLYHLMTGVAGIRPVAPGFAAAEIAPQFGPLSRIKTSLPTPKGPISVDLTRDGDAVSGTVAIPPGLHAAFVWRGRRRALRAGENAVEECWIPAKGGQ